MGEKLKHHQYTDPSSGKVLPMSQDDFGDFYSEYYQHETDDSPDRSRQHLIERLVTGIEEKIQQKQKVRILDMGAGRQVLERELQRHPRFKEIAPFVQIVTLDIAKMRRYQLLAREVSHITA